MIITSDIEAQNETRNNEKIDGYRGLWWSHGPMPSRPHAPSYGSKWVTRNVTVSDHVYDMGTFFIHDDRWTPIAPALPGPQVGFTGGEVGVFETTNPDNDWWQLKRRVTKDSPFNHGYVRRPHNPVDLFLPFGLMLIPKKIPYPKSAVRHNRTCNRGI